MIKKTNLFLILVLFNSFALGQNKDSKVVKAEHVETISTGKRHNSFFFIFKVNSVLKGYEKDSFIISQEIYHDFGAKQIISKIEKGEVLLKYNDIYNPENQIHGYKSYPKSKISPNKQVNLLWLVEPNRKKSLIRLEEKLKEYKTIHLNLLEEESGKLFFSIKGKKNMVAVETFSGRWIITSYNID